MEKYINKVREYYKKYYDLNDEAHRIDHADQVCINALEIMERLDIFVNKQVIVLAAYIHDIKCNVNRKTHNILASKYVMDEWDQDMLLSEMSENQRMTISIAVLQHRSSYKGERTSIVSNIIATADMGPVDLTETIMRSYKYNSEVPDKEVRIINVYNHLKEKFGTSGYRKYDKFYLDAYGDIVTEFNKEIDSITIDEVRDIVDSNL